MHSPLLTVAAALFVLLVPDVVGVVSHFGSGNKNMASSSLIDGSWPSAEEPKKDEVSDPTGN